MEHISKVTRKMTETALAVNAKVFAMYGRVAGNPIGGFVSSVVVVALVIGLSVGVSHVDYETKLENLWIEKGSRAETENNFVVDYYGGTGRIGQVAYSKYHLTPTSTDDHGILNKEDLYTWGNVTKPLLDGSGTIKTTATVDGSSHDFTYTDFCNRPPQSAYFLPWSPLALSSDTAYRNSLMTLQWLSAGSYAAGIGYYMSNCIRDVAIQYLNPAKIGVLSAVEQGYILAQIEVWFEINFATAQGAIGNSAAQSALKSSRYGLPAGWGIERFPCTRSNILDCWSDGIFDYPDDLKQLNSYARALSALYSGASQNLLGSHPFYTMCYAQFKSDANATLLQVYSQPVVNTYLSNFDTMHTAMYTLYGAGYWWRPSIEDSASHPGYTIADYFFDSMEETFNVTSTSTCVQHGLLRYLATIGIFNGSTMVYPLAPNYAAFLASTGYNTYAGCCTNWASVALSPNLFLGTANTPSDPTVSAQNSAYRFAHATRLSVGANNAQSPQLQSRLKTELGLTIDSDQLQTIMDDLDTSMIDWLNPMFEKVNPGVDIPSDSKVDFLMDRSDGDMLKDASNVDAKLMIAGYIALIVFSCYSFIRLECPPTKDAFVYSRSLICLIGMIVIGASNLASFGFMGWIGLKLSPLNSMLVPFLGVGLGLCDLFVLIHMFEKHAPLQNDIVKRLVVTMADAGSSITVTNGANAVAFLIPAGIVRLPAIYTFGYQMAAAIILNWIVVIFLIVPLLAIDAYRTKLKTSVIMPCIKADGDELNDEIKSNKYSLHHIIEITLCPLFTNKIFKVFSVCLFLGSTAFLGWYGFQNSDKGLKLGDVALKGLYPKSFLDLQYEVFPLWPSSLIQREIDFIDSDGLEKDIVDKQQDMLTFLDNIVSNHYIDKVNTPKSLHWLPSLISFYKSLTGDTISTTIPRAYFYSTLKLYFTTPGSSAIQQFVCQNTTSGIVQTDCSQVNGVDIKIIACQTSSYFNNIDTDPDYVDAINSIRSDTDNSPINTKTDGSGISPEPMFFAGSLFRYWQQYVGIQDLALRAVGYSMLGVFGTIFFFQFNLLSAILVGCMLLATVVQLYGFMTILSLKLNGFSLLNLACAVGLGVELSAYVSYSYLRHNAKTNDPDERMKLAVAEMFPPMFQGAMTGFISVIVLAFTKYPFFRAYYFSMVSMMIWLAFINGIWFLPIILSIINPIGLDKEHRAQSIGAAKSDPVVDNEDYGL